MGRNRLYLTLGILLTTAYAYVLWSAGRVHTHSGFVFCPIKKVTGIPCPSCGTTRSLMELLHGHFADAAHLNPLGIIAAMLMLVLPPWLFYDLATGKATFHTKYLRAEAYIKKHPVIIAFTALLMIANWIWNINKGL